MDRLEFSQIRRHLGKTQREMAQLLGTSHKAIQSFEQGWRTIPAHSERQILFLLALKRAGNRKTRPCWAIKRCDPEMRKKCPAWEFRAGRFCWFINGTICRGKAQKNWHIKMETCRTCKVYLDAFRVKAQPLRGTGPSAASPSDAARDDERAT